MSWFTKYAGSSIGKKQLMAVSGLAWAGFVLAHFIGNTPLIFGKAEAFNKYGHMLTSLGGLLYVAELGLLGLLLMHMALAIKTRMENKKARPVPYSTNVKVGKRSIASFSMPYTGMLILVFLIVHIATFKYGKGYVGTPVVYDGESMRDLYACVAYWFAQPAYAAFYVIVMAGLGLHLGHGVGSAMQTFGFNHPRYNGLISKVSVGYAVLVGGGNFLITLVMFLKGGA